MRGGVCVGGRVLPSAVGCVGETSGWGALRRRLCQRGGLQLKLKLAC